MRSVPSRITYPITICLLLCLFSSISCNKPDQSPASVNTIPVADGYFKVPANTNTSVALIANLLNRQNEENSFKDELIKNAGYAQWKFAKVINGNSSSRDLSAVEVINIPFVKRGVNTTSAILVATINGNDTSMELVYPQYYILYPMNDNFIDTGMQHSSTSVRTARDLFNVFSNYDFEMFGTENYIITDGRIFDKERSDTLTATVSHSNAGGMGEARVQHPDMTAADVMLVCNNVTVCRPLSSKKNINASLGSICTTTTNCVVTITNGGGDIPTNPGGGGGSGGGGNSSGGNGGGGGPILIPTTPCKRIANMSARQGGPCDVQPWVPVTPVSQTIADEKEAGLTDNDPDLKWWDTNTIDPNTNYIQQARPNYQTMYANYPKTADGTADLPLADVCKLIGGEVLTAHPGNACALRVSRALNYSGVIIPQIAGQTGKGADGKNYFYKVAFLYNWMGKTFGLADVHLTAADGAPNGTKFQDKIGGIQNKGIYIMTPKSRVTFNAGGHATLWGGLDCIGGHNYFAAASDVYVWRLPQ